MPGSERTERADKKVCACRGNTEILMEDPATLQARLKEEGSRAHVLQQRTGHLFKKLDDLSRRRDEALNALNKKKMELELRNNEIELIKTDIQKLRSDITAKEERAEQMESALRVASEKFNFVSNTVQQLTRSAGLHDRKTSSALRSAELAASRGYNTSSANI